MTHAATTPRFAAAAAALLCAACPCLVAAPGAVHGADSWREAMLAARAAEGAARTARIAAIERDFPCRWDWLLQDFGLDAAAWFAAPDPAEATRTMLGRVFLELGSEAAPFGIRAAQIDAAPSPADAARLLDLYADACERRRALRLAPLRARWREIVFTKHFNLGGSHYAYTEGQSDAQNERQFEPGASLCVLTLDEPRGSVRTLIDDAGGVIRDPEVSYDGARVLFAWKKSDRGDDYHLYELDTASGAVRQLTAGLGFADYEPAYLPNGDIVFNSTRCVQTVDCWWTEVSNLYACDRDGDFLRRLTFDQVHTNYPAVLDDGRVIYTRWEYSDRGQIFVQPLFQMQPDGTGQTELYGNNSYFPTTILHARGVPGTTKIAAILTGHHSRQCGTLAVIDTAAGNQEAAGVQEIAPVRPTRAARIDAYGQSGDLFQYPYPLDERTFLVACAPHGWRRQPVRFGIYLMMADGRRELLASDPAISCNQPVPLAARPLPRLHPNLVDYRRSEGVFYVHDVYAGAGLRGIPRGTIARLRVVALRHRAAGIRCNYNKGPGGGALISTPIAIGNGAWDVKVVLGDAEVYGDGSACFTVPARTPVYFQALDAAGHMVQTMRSWSTLQPGEYFACAGCHEPKGEAPRAGGGVTEAMRAGPRPLAPFYGPPRGFSFPREIQPILDAHCVRCHNEGGGVRGRTEAPEALDLGAAPVLSDLGAVWRYVTENPGEGWEKPPFVASSWRQGRAGFGCGDAPGGEIRTEWRTQDIWLRREFTLGAGPRPGLPVFRLCHDEDAELYLNGIPAAVVLLSTTEFVVHAVYPEAARSLRPGPNVLAVHCRSGGGGQFIDAALLDAAPGEAGRERLFSLRGDEVIEAQTGRRWSEAYLSLTGAVTTERALAANPGRGIVTWVHAQSAPPMLPPYSTGAARSRLIALLAEGHEGIELPREAMDKLACWIDLLVPFCGDYTEANAWSAGEQERYRHFLEKRARMEAIERGHVERLAARAEADRP